MKLCYASDTDVGRMIDPKASSLGLFDFKAFLNLTMLVTESERAKAIRSRILDIVIDVIAQKAGGILSMSTREIRITYLHHFKKKAIENNSLTR